VLRSVVVTRLLKSVLRVDGSGEIGTPSTIKSVRIGVRVIKDLEHIDDSDSASYSTVDQTTTRAPARVRC